MLGQVQDRLAFQPAVDGIVLLPAWQQVLQQPGTCPWQVDRQNHMAMHQQDSTNWHKVETDHSLPWLRDDQHSSSL